MSFSVQRTIREREGRIIVFDYLLLNSFEVVVGKFHDENLACKVRDLLNSEGDGI